MPRTCVLWRAGMYARATGTVLMPRGGVMKLGRRMKRSEQRIVLIAVIMSQLY